MVSLEDDKFRCTIEDVAFDDELVADIFFVLLLLIEDGFIGMSDPVGVRANCKNRTTDSGHGSSYSFISLPGFDCEERRDEEFVGRDEESDALLDSVSAEVEETDSDLEVWVLVDFDFEVELDAENVAFGA